MGDKMKDNFPANALVIKFKPLIGRLVRYRVWIKGDKYYWAACGNSGMEVNLEAAMRAAREYILMGVNGMQSHGEYRGVLSESRQQSN
jgi:hypothetical protein